MAEVLGPPGLLLYRNSRAVVRRFRLLLRAGRIVPLCLSQLPSCSIAGLLI